MKLLRSNNPIKKINKPQIKKRCSFINLRILNFDFQEISYHNHSTRKVSISQIKNFKDPTKS